MSKEKIDIKDCSKCRETRVFSDGIHCKLRMKSGKPTLYSKVTMVVGCVWFKAKM